MTGKALIVDDEESVRFFAASGLSQIGWQVDEASSGETALNLLEHNPFDILFLDLLSQGSLEQGQILVPLMLEAFQKTWGVEQGGEQFVV